MSDSIILYGNRPLSSPYVFSAFVALEEKGLEYELRLLSLENKEHLEQGYATDSLTNRVPALEHGEFWLAESTAITEYLDEVFPPPSYPRLYPEDPRQRARVRMVQGLLRSDFMPIREERSAETLFQKGTAGSLSLNALAAVERLFRIAGQLVSGAGSTITGQFSLADADLALMLQRLIHNGDPTPQPLVDYAGAIFERPSVRKFLALTQYQDAAPRS
jgi:glutathione S-transferase